LSYFVYHSRSKPTGELLAQALQMNHGMSPSAYDDDYCDVLIRWGSRANSIADSLFSKVLNPITAINSCSNKLLSLETFYQEGINCPIFSEDPHELVETVGYPILGRKLRHARGTDIELILQERDIRRSKSDYFVEYIPTNREFRVHVVGEKVIRVQGKFLDNPSESKPWFRNYENGYRFRAPKKRLKSDRLEAAVSAVKSLGLDFGAVDLIIADDGSCYVLEVNTAPSCSPLTLAAYAVELHELANLETEVNLNILDMLDPQLEEMDSDDEVSEE